MGKKQVIVVEDEGALLLGLRLNLISLGVEVTCFENGKIAYDDIVFLCNKGRVFDLLIVDIDLPGINGIELVETFKLQNINIPSVFISGYTEAELKKKFGVQNRIHFLQKPFSFSDLDRYIYERLQLHIGQHQEERII